MTTVLDSAPRTVQELLPVQPLHQGGRAAVIINPSKFRSEIELLDFREAVSAAFSVHAWLPPLWLMTTAVTRGAEEARWARSAGVDVVLVAGGDGTVRTVAQELAGSGVALGLLPMGTGNLLARNLGVPVGDIPAAVRIACGSGGRLIDVGWLELDSSVGGAVEQHAFLVMAGAGFDAATMAGAGGELKSRLGRFAYIVSGARALTEQMVDSALAVDTVMTVSGMSRGFVVGNCGELSMGLTLMPEADPGDGVLDGVVLRPRGLLDWAHLVYSVIAGRPIHRLMPRLRGRVIDYHSAVPQRVEVDGDVVGEARYVRARVDPAALLVRA
jgi:diacylglycerol kinase (ATP)